MERKKLFNPIKVKLAESLAYLFENKSAASKVINYTFKNNKKWGSRDRKSFAEAFYSIVRDFGVYQSEIGFRELQMDKLKESDFQKIIELYEKGFDPRSSSSKKESLVYSVSQDLLSALDDELSDSEKVTFLKSSLNTADVFLRVNNLLTSDEECLKALKGEGVECKIVKKGCIKLLVRKNVFILDCFKKGFFEVQDGASQKVAPFMDLEPHFRIADCCAGAGGKTLHMASVLGNKGKIVAMDIFPRRLEELKKRSKRAKAQNIEIKPIEGTKTIKRMQGKFDRVLLDVPCTGTGTYRRKPESRMFFTKDMHEELMKVQREVLMLHSTLVKEGGVMVYSTCSILPSENKKQVDWFLEQNPNFKFIEDDLNHVGQDEFDGFYMAKLKKVGES